MNLTKEDLNNAIADTPGLRLRFVGDLFIHALTSYKPGQLLREHPEMLHWPIRKIIAYLLEETRTTTAAEAKAEEAYRRTAKEEHQEDGRIEFDDSARVSLSDDGGAYVQCWHWVSAADASRCNQTCCHADISDGEGQDGMCGNCADLIEEPTDAN